jgi:hypothetical protein
MIALFLILWFLWFMYKRYRDYKHPGLIPPPNRDPRPTPYLVGVGGTNNTLNPRYIEWCLRNCVELPDPRKQYDSGYDGFL